MIYLLLNCDEYLASFFVRKCRNALGEPEVADLNTNEFSGSEVTASGLLGQGSIMPFLAERRLLIARDFLGHLDKRMAMSRNPDSAAHLEAAQLLEGLPYLPDTCDLVFIDDGVDKRRQLWRGFTLPETSKQPKRKVAGLSDLVKKEVVNDEVLTTPDIKELGGWIQRRAQAKTIRIDGRAVSLLADFVGPNLRQLDNELEKLATYASGRTITADDVKMLVSDASEALIWSLTDALSQRDGRSAIRSLYELRRNDANPFYLLTMMARQYRIMIKVKEAAMTNPRGNEYDIAKMVGESAYPVKKAMQQSRQYAPKELDDIMMRLLEADFAMKTGADPETTIDVLVAELTQRKD